MDIRDEVAAFATIQSRLTAALSTPPRPASQISPGDSSPCACRMSRFASTSCSGGEVGFGVHDAFHEPPDWLHEIAGSLNVLKLFEGYMEHGTRPMFTEGVDSYGIRESRNPGSNWIDAYARYGRLY